MSAENIVIAQSLRNPRRTYVHGPYSRKVAEEQAARLARSVDEWSVAVWTIERGPIRLGDYADRPAA